MKEMEKLANEYRTKYDSAMKNVVSLQKKLTLANTRSKKSEIMYDTLKKSYNKLNTLFERVKLSNFDSLRKMTREQTEYWNMVQDRRFNPQHKPRKAHRSSNRRNKYSTQNLSKEANSKSSFTESIVIGELEEEDFDLIKDIEDKEVDLEFLNKTLDFEKFTRR